MNKIKTLVILLICIICILLIDRNIKNNYLVYIKNIKFSTESWEWVDVEKSNIKIYLYREKKMRVFICTHLRNGSLYYDTSWSRIAIKIDGYIKNIIEHQNYDIDKKYITNSSTSCLEDFVVFGPGVHDVRLQVSTDGKKTNGYLEYVSLSILEL